MSKLKLVVGGVLALLVVIVALQNTEDVHTKVLFFTLTAPRIVLLLVTFVAGAVFGGLVTSLALGGGKPKE